MITWRLDAGGLVCRSMQAGNWWDLCISWQAIFFFKQSKSLCSFPPIPVHHVSLSYIAIQVEWYLMIQCCISLINNLIYPQRQGHGSFHQVGAWCVTVSIVTSVNVPSIIFDYKCTFSVGMKSPPSIGNYNNVNQES